MATESDPQIKFTFVEMLFALTVAEVAIQIADLVTSGAEFWSFRAAYMHLFLALFVVATSWVGWYRSQAPGNLLDVDSVLSWPFLVLLIDVLLVVCYFVIVKGVDIARVDDTQIVEPSAQNETIWLMVVFCGYLIWDVITKAVISVSGEPKFFKRLFGREFWPRGWVSVVCALLSFFAWWKLYAVTGQNDVLSADLSLLSLVFLFRAMKAKAWIWTTICFISFLVFLVIASLATTK